MLILKPLFIYFQIVLSVCVNMFTTHMFIYDTFQKRSTLIMVIITCLYNHIYDILTDAWLRLSDNQDGYDYENQTIEKYKRLYFYDLNNAVNTLLFTLVLLYSAAQRYMKRCCTHAL